ncbi:glycoside hydrolase family 3 C-terminal domain-containing protein, partial [Sediminibacterium sp.]|uniref:glycoside hydrolase family 3 C-terminal domain-containing protein n=1 Tax=Sediminibacterium sp. TaxID=1917865 RepID=UPI003F6994F9
GFKGFVISDAGAVGGSTVLHHTTADYPASSADAINNGLDVIFQTQYKHHELFMPPFLDGSISKERIDDAVKRVLRIKFELGLFDQPFIDENEAAKWVINPAHKKLARDVAAKSFVLLKNSQKVLPIQPAVRTIAVIGEEAVKGRLGGYSGPGNGVVTILDGIKTAAGKNRKLVYAKGAAVQYDPFSVIPAENLYTDKSGSSRGLMASYFSGLEPGKSLVKSTIVNELNESYTFMSPDSNLDANHFSVRYAGFLVPEKTGQYQLALEGNDGFRMYLDNRLIIDQWSKLSYRRVPVSLMLEKGKRYAIRVEFYESKGNAKIKLLWNRAMTDSTERMIANAVAVARQSDLALIVASIHEGEFQDRARLSLTANQEKLIEAVAATRKPVVVMLTGGSAITMEKWLDKVNGVVMLWYPGEEGGNAVGDILFGKKNPAGRLPITFPVSEGQVPLVYNHKPTGRGDDYHDLSGEPLFPFGYGLSYSDFEFTNLRFSSDSLSANGEINVYVDVENIGKIAGEEVVQLYVNDLLSSVATPVLSLKDFRRIHLLPREKKTVVFSLNSKLLYLINKEGKTVFEPGWINIMIGKNSKELMLKKKLMLWKSE